MIKEVIQVISTEQKQGARGPYLEVTYRDEKGVERKKNIFDQTLWDVFQSDAWVEWQLEKEGNWWNVKGAESVKGNIEELRQEQEARADTVQQNIRENMEWKQENIAQSFWYGQMGNRIGDGSLDRDFPKSATHIKTQYYKQMSKITGVTFKEEPIKEE